jgi:hypothetical protein
VLNAGTCDATEAGGCGLTPATAGVGDSGGGSSGLTIAENPLTDALYATDLVTAGPSAFTGSNRVRHRHRPLQRDRFLRCQQTSAHITLAAVESSGSTPVGLAVDPVTDTVYTADLDGGDAGTGTVGVIDGATCNGQTTSGCGRPPSTLPTGDYPGASLAEVAQASPLIEFQHSPAPRSAWCSATHPAASGVLREAGSAAIERSHRS